VRLKEANEENSLNSPFATKSPLRHNNLLILQEDTYPACNCIGTPSSYMVK